MAEEHNIEDVFNIDPLDLNDAFCRLPAELAYHSYQYALAYRKAAAAKAAEKQVIGGTREVVREKLLATRGKATLPDIEAAIDTHEDVVEAREQTIEAEYDKVRLQGIVDAIRSKRDMLISIGAHVRAEMDHDPSIKSRYRQGTNAEDHEWGETKG